MTILYTILELSCLATQEDIKGAYRRLAKMYHPDANPNASPEKITHFQRIQEAYQILYNPEQRLLYDQKEKEKRLKYQSNFDPLGDLFAQMNRNFPHTSAESLKEEAQVFSYSLKISFAEACLGTQKTLTIAGEKMDITIPPGVTHKSTLEFSLKENYQGKVLVILYVDPHPHLVRVDQNIHLTLPITFMESIVGSKIEIPTLEGPFMLKVPPYIASGTELVLKGRGIAGKILGDFHIRILITPPKESSEELEDILKKFEKSNPYNPRPF